MFQKGGTSVKPEEGMQLCNFEGQKEGQDDWRLLQRKRMVGDKVGGRPDHVGP